MFAAHINKHNPDILQKWTQRKLLGLITRLFDPLGITAPVTIVMKIKLQEIWRNGQHWDEELPEDLQQFVKEWTTNTAHLNEIKIPRFYNWPTAQPIELHVFCDASSQALATVIFIRFAHKTVYQTKFVIGKTRVAPLKPQTIPKLELQAAVYSCRLQRAFIKNTTLSVSKITHWTDITVVLHWIYNINNRQKTYIANRLHEIRHTTAINDWKYVPTKLNPADEGTRGIKTTELKHSQWMNGPAFLKLLSHLWPRTIEDTTPSTLDNMPTSKTDDIQTYSLICNTPHTFVDYKQFSSWKRLLRTTIYVLKTLDLAKRRLSTVKERYQRSKDILFRVAQNESFPEDIKDIQRTQTVKARSKIVNFNPYLDQEGTLRSLSRLQKAPINFRIKNPQIVDAKHYIIRLYIQHIHEDEGHVGLEHMRVILQQEHWMTHLTITLKQIIYNCLICKRQRQLLSQPKMGNLPEFRFAKTPAAFEDIGMDYFGHFPVYQRNQRTSQYVCIFTCFRTRAVHFEVVEDLTTDSCLLAIRRFTSRRGKPTSITSDNASTFHAAAKSLDLGKIEEKLGSQQIDWKFIPPGTPHEGGAWERLIRMAKRILYPLSGTQSWTQQTFNTFICQVEGIMNSRPLTKASADSNDIECLTPNHFIIPRRSNFPTTALEANKHTDRLIQLNRQCESNANQFWTRLMKEYLPTLRPQSKWHTTKDPIMKGQVVWILENNSPRVLWPLGLVTEVYPGSDNIVRKCKLKTKTGETVKSAHQLCPLECNGNL